jgi:hypothetical protein
MKPIISPLEITEPDKIEFKAHNFTYNSMTEEERALILYVVDTSQKHPAGFYTCLDYPDIPEMCDEVIGLLNADLKRWLIFYGAPEPGTLEWWTVVVHHRDVPLLDKLVSIQERYVSLEPLLFPEEEEVEQ